MQLRKEHRKVESHWPTLLAGARDQRAIESAENEGWRVPAHPGDEPAAADMRACTAGGGDLRTTRPAMPRPKRRRH